MPGNQFSEIREYLENNKASGLELYALKYSFYINAIIVLIWVGTGIFVIYKS